MCGIAGIINIDKSCMGHAIQKMTDVLKHRGPDGLGYAALNPGEALQEPASEFPGKTPSKVWLGHRRLSIIDLKGSKQPLRNEDGTVWVVFNGEIYNYPELRADLSKRGHVLKEAGDTEVLVHLWEEYGAEMLHHLTGMFAFAIYDTRSDTLFIARDRFGQKPLYY
jgi:asparagine synthase (glutamine-hydrolysing)